jgi:tetratricopeptide (TPR) repeat protein
MRPAGPCRPLMLILILLLLPQLSPVATAQDAPVSSVTQLLDSGQLETAETALRQILATEDSAVARDLLGVALSRQGRHREAEAEFRRALALDPTLLDARQHLARTYLLDGREPEAREQLRAAAVLGDLDRDLAMKLGVVEMTEGNAAAAASQFRFLVERHGSVQAALYLARIEASRQGPEAALVTLRQARELAPNSEEVLRAHARAALDAGLPVEAIVALEPLTRMHPDAAEYAYLMGIARLQVGDSAGAVEALQQARQQGPPRPLPLIALGLALNRQKNYAEARSVILESLRLEPDNIEGLAGLAEAQAGLLELEAAETNALRVLARKPDHATANLVLGMVRMQQQRYPEARDALLRAVEADPGSPKAHYQLSLAYARLQQPEASRKHLELYQQALQAFEKQLEELGPAGSSSGG